MTLRFQDLSAAIDRNDVRAVVEQLQGAFEAERRALSSKVRALAKGSWDFRGNRAAAAIAVLGTAGGVRQISQVLDVVALGNWVPEAVDVLSHRSRTWTADLPAALLTGRHHVSSWQLARAIVRAGLAPKPDLPEYTTGMPWALRSDTVPGQPTPKSIEEHLLADPDLLKDEVFRLFRVEGAGKALYWADTYRPPERTWRATLARMARKGLIDYDRLLDECNGAFLRDFRPVLLGWYVAMHDELAPNIDEMAARVNQYQRLLGADASVGVGLGQKAIERLVRARRIDLQGLVAASAPALHRPEKGIVLRQLRLLDKVRIQRPDLAPLVRGVVVPVLTHERPEIREAAAAMMDQLGLATTAEPFAGDSGPATGRFEASDENSLKAHETSLRVRATRLIGESIWADPIKLAIEAVEAGAIPDPPELRIGPGRRLPSPICEPDELLEVFTTLIENARDPIALERALAGAVRTSRIPLAQRRRIAEPLAKRAREQMGGYPTGLNCGDVRPMVASVAYTWATGSPVRAGFRETDGNYAIEHSSLDGRMAPVTPTGAFAVRAIEAIQLIANCDSIELLSEPTHDRGGIDPEEFVRRAEQNYGGWLGHKPPRYDLEVAALRLGRTEGVDHLGDLPREVRSRLCALTAELPDVISPSLVAGRPSADRWERKDPVVLASVQSVGAEASILGALTNLADPLASHKRLAAEWEFGTDYGASIATWPLIAPWHPELIAAHLLRPLSRGLRSGKHDLAASAVGCLVHRDWSLGPIGHMALALGCNGAEADTRTAAADVFGAAARDGRLQPVLLAASWLELARAGVFQAKRVEATLRPLTAQPTAGIRLAQTLELTLGPLVETGTRDMHVLLRLAASLARTYGVFPGDPHLAGLAERKGASELLAAARALARTTPQALVSPKAASLDWLEGLLERAERTCTPDSAIP